MWSTENLREWIQWNICQVFVNCSRKATHLRPNSTCGIMAHALWLSVGKSPSSPVLHLQLSFFLTSNNVCAFLPFDTAVRTHPSPPAFTAKLSALLLSWFHRHCPSPGFQQLLWASVSCQKSFSSWSSTGASQWKPKKTTSCDGAQPMSGTHYCTLPGGKAHSESMNVSIFNLSDRKRGAKPPLLKQCLNVTHNMFVWFHKHNAAFKLQEAYLLQWTITGILELTQRAHIHTLIHRLTYVLTDVLTCACTCTKKKRNIITFTCKESHTHAHESWHIVLMPVTPSGSSRFLSALISQFPLILLQSPWWQGACPSI